MAEEFGPFHLERLLGRGGMAEVFVARRRDSPEGERIVLKRIRPDLAQGDEYIKRFVLEAQVASRLSHPNLVRFHEFGQVGECRYIAMDLVRGHSLHRLLELVFEREEPPPLEVGLFIAAGILDGLSAMHEVTDERGRARPVLHRDITPKNVIIARDGRPIVIDFGIAKDVLGPQITLPGKVIGTARYMAPEHRRAEFIDTRADVFSVSVILFEILTGRHPWPPLETIKELLRVTFDPPEIPSDVRAKLPPDIEGVVMKGLACEPSKRFETAQEMSLALKASPSFLRIGDQGLALTQGWASSFGVPADEDLTTPVLDHAPAVRPGREEWVWSPEGDLAPARAASMSGGRTASARILPVPPLPPPREAALTAGDVDVRRGVPGRLMWVIAVVIASLLAGAVGGFLFLRSS